MLNRSQNAFTLIELMISLVIIGILTGVALPHFASYKQKAYDSAAANDLRNVALAEEAYFLDAERYLSCKDTACAKLPGIHHLSKGVNLQITATTSGFHGTALNKLGGRTFKWSSLEGGMVD